MDILQKNELKDLFLIKGDPCISIYIPTFKKGAEVAQNIIRFRQKLKESEIELKKLGYRDILDDLMKKPQFLIFDTDFWNFQESGFACFISPKQFMYYRLPISFNEELVIGKKYYLRPLLPFFVDNKHFYILVLDQNELKFYKAFNYGIEQIEVAGAPKSLQESTKYDIEEQYTFNMHTGAPNVGRTTIAWGQGSGADDKPSRKRKILRYFQKVNDSINNYLKSETAPLITAGVDYLHPIYREANTYPYIWDKGIIYNTEDLRSSELLDLALDVARPYIEKDFNYAREKFGDLVSHGKASFNFTEIVKASQTNQIAYLMVDKTAKVWGRLNPEYNSVEIHSPKEAGDEDLMDILVANTVIQNGEIFVLNPEEMPASAPASAIFRYQAS